MGDKKQYSGPRRPPASKEKRPPITHFLCIPLVNAASLPQLESSLAAFKAALPLAPQPPHHGLPSRKPVVERPLIPRGAIRPVGTLHLTLGVMSLPTQQRLEEAIKLLHSLDLASMAREAERSARRSRTTKNKSQSTTSQIDNDTITNPSPFTVSLESLSAIPRARAATVLHAAPVDSSSRLYPFCEILRDKFLEAGFLQAEVKKDKRPEGVPQQQSPQQSAQLSPRQQQQQQQQSDISNRPPAAPKPKLRPLLLHATVVNTIYIKGRQQPAERGLNGKNRRNQYTFDARDILTHYRDYYVDGNRVTPRSDAVVVKTPVVKTSTHESTPQGGSDDEEASAVSSRKEKFPFVWARDFPLDAICICEMGAKKLDLENDPDGMNARLGEKYRVVAERRLDFGSAADA
ncbi:hypothetical protein P168DRAFT_289290 [Aspergillus campestris IBT 28561]|uniref:A-kinase anchor protein 7-like phosphoesterase domain-containing protein n=1 Tax=Aspergillus campestris (strain IBT 28561) TaxID=1392248 RepID=A0A2I1D7M2_ASPC2|nr:uncharacterized protein P168DRAFT_289290 [Aspergillus campestris IBT 28561]PKY05881.1 hypothetical protein P168DRAFT_289290 [Aspergillus campestris IBT 28561]